MKISHAFLDDYMVDRLQYRLQTRTVRDFLYQATPQLAQVTGLDVVIIETIKSDFAILCENEPIASRENHLKHVHQQKHIRLCLGKIALPRGSIVEVYGPAASGKTLFCNMMAVDLSARGLNCLWIDTIGFSGVKTLQALYQVSPKADEATVLNRIRVQQVFDAKKLISVLEYLCNSEPKAEVLFIDSMSSIFHLIVGISFSVVNFYVRKAISCLRLIAIKKNITIFFTSLPDSTNNCHKRFNNWSTHRIYLRRRFNAATELNDPGIRNCPERLLSFTSLMNQKSKHNCTFAVKLSDGVVKQTSELLEELPGGIVLDVKSESCAN